MLNRAGKDQMSVKERFLAKVRHVESCWIWTACTETRDGYGRFRCNGKSRYAHRVAYELFKKTIPEGLTVDHRCRNRACVNPKHLRLLTRENNVLAGTSFSARNRLKTHCPQGHEFDLVRTRPDGKRQFRTCRRCERRRRRESYARNKKGKT